jgi:hypothetical protein
MLLPGELYCRSGPAFSGVGIAKLGLKRVIERGRGWRAECVRLKPIAWTRPHGLVDLYNPRAPTTTVGIYNGQVVGT